MEAANTKQGRISIVIPLYNDWDSLGLLLGELDPILREQDLVVELLVVDDSSTIPMPSSLPPKPLKGISSVDILQLRTNLGHQRAIAVGLAFVHSRHPCDAVVVMDSDGEDKPSDVPGLIRKFKEEGAKKIIFAERTKRSESALFRLFYRLYRIVHRLLTGFSVRVGNFSIIPFALLDNLVVASELWNHYAATVFKAKLPYSTTSIPRGMRLSGQGKMNFVQLVVHGLSALSVYGDTIGVRLLMAATGLVLFVITSLLLVLVIRLTTSLAIPGWATYTTGILLIILFQIIMISFLLIFTILQNRSNLAFLPIRDYQHFVKSVTRVYPQ